MADKVVRRRLTEKPGFSISSEVVLEDGKYLPVIEVSVSDVIDLKVAKRLLAALDTHIDRID